MKKRIFGLVLALTLLVTALVFSPKASASTVYFSAVNDTLLELSSGSMPAYIGGALYVPYTMVNNSTLGVYFSYDRTEQKASLLYGGKQIYFDMASGETFDAEGNTYSATAAYYNSKVYLPVDFICSFFGFTYSYINSEGLGAIVRIKDGNVVLSDTLFERAAHRLMTDRLNKYLGSSPSAPPEETDPGEEPSPEYGETALYLGFTGLENGAAVLDALAEYEMHATFFVTGSEIAAAPDLIRRILCAGHNLGIRLEETPEADYTRASELLFSAARRRTLLVWGTEAPEETVACTFDVDAAAEGVNLSGLRRAAANGGKRLSVHFDCGGDAALLSGFLRYLDAGQFAVRPFNELLGGE